jgi:hypothetical protein
MFGNVPVERLVLIRLLIDELTAFTKNRPASTAGTPPLLLQIQCDIESRLNRRFTLNDLAEKAGCSPPVENCFGFLVSCLKAIHVYCAKFRRKI